MNSSSKYQILERFKKGSITLEYSKENVEICGEHIRRGELVGFPTETVYGLGADATNDEAVEKIFKAKERPLNDPVIVHVTSFKSAKEIIDPKIDKRIQRLLELMTVEFWPGPLTLVVKCSKNVSQKVTGGTGNVGIRCPSNEIARALIDVSGRPIAAPSANKFGHVSPTSYKHVEDDLGNTNYPIAILKGKEKCCQVGIESTVCRLSIFQKCVKLQILRKGGTSTDSIIRFSSAVNSGKFGSEYSQTVVEIKSKIVKMESDEKMCSPGQLITHYSPNLPSYLIKSFSREKFQNQPPTNSQCTRYKLSKCVLIDFHQYYKSLEGKCMAYFDLSDKGDVEASASMLFSLLRSAEKVEGAAAIILPNLKNISKEHSDACHDRLYRAASGKFCDLGKDEIFLL